MKKIIAFLAIIICTNVTTFTYSQQRVPASPHPIEYTQPNGVEIKYRLHGDANLKYTTTIDGYLIKKNDNGYFYYLTYSESKKRYVMKCKVGIKKTPRFAMKPNEHYINSIINRSSNRPM